MTASPLHTLLVDDEKLAIRRLRVLCGAIEGVEIVAEASDGAAAIDAIARHAPALVLLDVSMPELDGLAVARAAAADRGHPSIVFCTASERHAVAAFELAAVDYLLKPVAEERLARAVARVRALRSGAGAPARTPPTPSAAPAPDAIWVPHRGAMLRLPLDRIDRIEAQRDYMRIRAGAETYLLLETISRLEELLDPAMFIRLRRSVIVRRDHVAGLRHDGSGTWLAELADGTSVRIGATRRQAVKAMLA